MYNGDYSIIGTCSECGGPVGIPKSWWSVIPPTPKCLKCGAVAQQHHGPVIPMTPKKPSLRKPWRDYDNDRPYDPLPRNPQKRPGWISDDFIRKDRPEKSYFTCDYEPWRFDYISII